MHLPQKHCQLKYNATLLRQGSIDHPPCRMKADEALCTKASQTASVTNLTAVTIWSLRYQLCSSINLAARVRTDLRHAHVEQSCFDATPSDQLTHDVRASNSYSRRQPTFSNVSLAQDCCCESRSMHKTFLLRMAFSLHTHHPSFTFKLLHRVRRRHRSHRLNKSPSNT